MLTIDDLIDELELLRALHGGDLPVAMSGDDDGNCAVYCKDLDLAQLDSMSDAPLSRHTLWRVMSQDDAGPDSVRAVVLWPEVHPL
jgi:hypothetical protein